jgi:hypothetical protein
MAADCSSAVDSVKRSTDEDDDMVRPVVSVVPVTRSEDAPAASASGTGGSGVIVASLPPVRVALTSGGRPEVATAVNIRSASAPLVAPVYVNGNSRRVDSARRVFGGVLLSLSTFAAIPLSSAFKPLETAEALVVLLPVASTLALCDLIHLERDECCGATAPALPSFDSSGERGMRADELPLGVARLAAGCDSAGVDAASDELSFDVAGDAVPAALGLPSPLREMGFNPPEPSVPECDVPVSASFERLLMLRV